MKVYLDNQLVFDVTENHINMIKYDMASDRFVSDFIRRLQWIINEQIKFTHTKMKMEWEPLLIQRGIKCLPVDPIEFHKLVSSQPDYKDLDDKIAQQTASTVESSTFTCRSGQ